MSYELKRPARGGKAGRAVPVRAGAAVKEMAAAGALGIALALTLAIIATGCGKEGPPTPPLREVPAPTKDLVVRQRGTHVLLSFRYPQTTPGGQALGGVSKVEVYDAVIPPPKPEESKSSKGGKTPKPGTPGTTGATGATGAAGATGTAAGTAKAGAGTPAGTTGTGAGGAGGSATGGGTAGTTASTATTPASGGQAAGTGGAGTGTAGTSGTAAAAGTPDQLPAPQLEKLAKLKTTLTGKDLGTATLGNFLQIDIPLAEPLPANPPTNPDTAPTHAWAVRTFGPKGDRSAFSNQAMLKPKTPPQPPEGVTVAGQADGVEVEWKAVSGAGGYAVYRRAATERFSAKPLAVVKPPATRFLDQSAAFGQGYIYSVTAVDPKDPQVESAIQSEMEIHYVDRYPPPVPADLVAVAETARVRLVWRQSEAPDLAGYIVYRKGASGGFERLTDKPVTGTTYVDPTALSGQTYDYRVTAIDQTGNESAPSGEARIAVP